jgi:hypothetical protein
MKKRKLVSRWLTVAAIAVMAAAPVLSTPATLYAADSSVGVAAPPTLEKLPAKYIVGMKHDAPLYQYQDGRYVSTSRTLKIGSTWQAFSKTTGTDQTWYQLRNNQWVNVNDLGEMSTAPRRQ